MISTRKFLLLKAINVNITCLFTASYTVIGHASNWRKRSRSPRHLTTDYTAKKSGDLVIARDQVIEGPLKHGRTEEGEGFKRAQDPDVARTARGASLIQYVRLKFE